MRGRGTVFNVHPIEKVTLITGHSNIPFLHTLTMSCVELAVCTVNDSRKLCPQFTPLGIHFVQSGDEGGEFSDYHHGIVMADKMMTTINYHR